MTEAAAGGGGIRQFWPALVVTAAVLAVTGVVGTAQDIGVVAILGVLEISLSFDNAVVNATVLQRMAAYWQRLFLTLGIVIAVFGMRLVFPVVVVCLSGHLSVGKALDLALHHPGEYAAKLEDAHPAIAAFGGIFLLMIFLEFVFEDRDLKWLRPLEVPLAKIGKLEALAATVSLVALLVLSLTYVPSKHESQVLVSGVAGLATFLLVNSLSSLFEEEEEEVVESEAAQGVGGGGDAAPVKLPGAARAGIFLFLYLEVLDASFSFDGVVGAFAITDKIFVIAAGLGIGAMYIRSLTVYLVRQGTLSEYVYLEHGAHWAIGSLAVILFISLDVRHQPPELVTGLIGVAFIGAAFVSSVLRRRRGGDAGLPDPGTDIPAAVSAAR